MLGLDGDQRVLRWSGNPFVANPMKAVGSNYVVQWLFCCIRTF